jgi:hypothetical protein
VITGHHRGPAEKQQHNHDQKSDDQRPIVLRDILPSRKQGKKIETVGKKTE